MTRENAIDILNEVEKHYSEWDDEYGYNCYEVENIINRIYDSLEQRTCEACNLCEETKISSPFCNKHNYWLTEESIKVLKCNQWEAKEKQDD